MNAVFKSVLFGTLVFAFAAFALHAQGSPAKPQVTPDYSYDPCGNPTIESQLWFSVKGSVLRVISSSTLVVTVPDRTQALRVYLVGVGPGTKEQATAKAQELLSRLLLDKPIEILVNSSWDSKDNKPREVSGVVHLEDSTGRGDDVGLFLLSKGLLKFQEPVPYSMSRYTECQYKRAEAKALTGQMGNSHSSPVELEWRARTCQ